MDIKKYLERNDSIIIDTSVLMNYESVISFFEQNRDRLVNNDTKIIVPEIVVFELDKLSDSSDYQKRKRAKEALKLLYEYEDLFIFQKSKFDTEEKANIIADAELLALLTRNRLSSRQLLISNDKKLVSDAYAINKQESCFGNDVWVCRMSLDGKLKTCDCVYKAQEDKQMTDKSVGENSNSKAPYIVSAIIGSAALFGGGFYLGKRTS